MRPTHALIMSHYYPPALVSGYWQRHLCFLTPVSREDTYKLGSHHCIHNLLFAGISPVFISVWLAEIIILTSLLVGGYYLYIRNKRTHTPGQSTHITHLHLLLSLH